MNVNGIRSQRPAGLHEAPDGWSQRAGEGERPSTPAEVLAILDPGREKPAAILIGSLWKTGLLPEGALS